MRVAPAGCTAIRTYRGGRRKTKKRKKKGQKKEEKKEKKEKSKPHVRNDILPPKIHTHTHTHTNYTNTLHARVFM